MSRGNFVKTVLVRILVGADWFSGKNYAIDVFSIKDIVDKIKI